MSCNYFKRRLIPALLAVLISAGSGCAIRNTGALDKFYVIKGYATGTSYHVKCFLPERGNVSGEELEISIRNRLAKIEKMMSVFISDSEISRFNRSKETGWFAVSPETAKVVDESLKISALSGGAFDITIAPLINLWGFGTTGARQAPPDSSSIELAKKNCGYKNLRVRVSPPAMSKAVPQLTCSLSAVAQGYASDDIALLLESNGIKSYMIEIGGEIKARGVKPDGSPWLIGIAAPEKGEKIIKLAIRLDDTAVSTSGDYQNYFDKNGKRYSHTIDPATGYPITHGLASVTVIHESCMRADAMATAIDVLGPDKGYDLAVKEKLPVYLIIHDGQKFREKMTPQFEAFIGR